MNRVVRTALVPILLLLGPLLLFQGQANSFTPSGPWLAKNGFNLADIARAGLRVRQANGVTTLGVESNALDSAREAFVREPLATNALFVLAVDERAANPGRGRQDLLDAAAALDKRNRFLGALQMEQFSRSGDFASTFALIDRLARIYPDLTTEFVQPLVQSLRQDDALDVIAEALDSEPGWANSFWRSVPSDRLLVGRMLALRLRTSKGTDNASDGALLAGLAAAQMFDEAFAFRDSLQGGAPAGTGPAGTGFVPVGGVAPFGWQTEASGERSLSQRGDNGYEIFVQQGTNGELGRQLLRLAPGRYTFSAAITPLSAAENITARLQCATATSIVTPSQPMTRRVTFSVPATCRTWWLVLGGNAWAVSGGVRSTIADMRFQAAR
ncbi:MAG: hypothetical protein ABIT10_13265 [Alteraurantiacibacter sp.]